jgi:hypothetical protein
MRIFMFWCSELWISGGKQLDTELTGIENMYHGEVGMVNLQQRKTATSNILHLWRTELCKVNIGKRNVPAELLMILRQGVLERINRLFSIFLWCDTSGIENYSPSDSLARVYLLPRERVSRAIAKQLRFFVGGQHFSSPQHPYQHWEILNLLFCGYCVSCVRPGGGTKWRLINHKEASPDLYDKFVVGGIIIFR